MDKVSGTARATAIFRIVQEALTNVMRHAAASQVNISLERKGDALVVEVIDNGIGIKEERVFDSKSLGLIGIRERVLLLGGEADHLRGTRRGNRDKSDSSHKGKRGELNA